MELITIFEKYKSSQDPWVGPVERKEDPKYIKFKANDIDKSLIETLGLFHSIDAFEELEHMVLDTLFSEGIYKSFYSSDSITVNGMDSFKDILKNSPKEYLFISPEFASVINNDIIYSPVDKHKVNIPMDEVGVWESKNIVIFAGTIHNKCYLLSTRTICDIELKDDIDLGVNVYTNKDLEGFILEDIDIPVYKPINENN